MRSNTLVIYIKRAITSCNTAAFENPAFICFFNFIQESFFRIYELISEVAFSATSSTSRKQFFTTGFASAVVVSFFGRLISHWKLILSCAIPRTINVVAGFLLVSILAVHSWPGQKSQFLENPKLNTEFEQNYYEHKFGNFVSLIASTATITQLNFSSATATGRLSMGGNKIINLANGTASSDAATYGQLIYLAAPVQVVNTTNFSTTANTYQATNLTASITPTSASSRVEVCVYGTLSIAAAAGGPAGFGTIYRGASTNLATGANLAFAIISADSGGVERTQLATCIIDSPATTSSTAYTVRTKNDDGATAVLFGGASDTQMILKEVR